MKTKVINLLGGPGVKKSSMAAGLFYMFKMDGFNCELVREYAKKLTWENAFEKRAVQSYVTAKQHYEQVLLEGKVDLIVTDSPIILGNLYAGKGFNSHFASWLMEVWDEFENVNLFLQRDHSQIPYNPKGRTQTQEEAEELDQKLKDFLDVSNIPYEYVTWENGRHAMLEKLYHYSRKAVDPLYTGRSLESRAQAMATELYLASSKLLCAMDHNEPIGELVNQLREVCLWVD